MTLIFSLVLELRATLSVRCHMPLLYLIFCHFQALSCRIVHLTRSNIVDMNLILWLHGNKNQFH